MSIERRAVLDVGSNSIKLLVADVEDRSVIPVIEQSRQTRLGQGLYRANVLQPDRIEATVQAAREFTVAAREQGVRSLRVIATSATRDALNRNQLTLALESVTGSPVEIITGEREADLAFAGVCTDKQYQNVPVLILEVGGGSSQILLGRGASVHYRASLPLGTVRLLQCHHHGDPPLPEEHLACEEFLATFLSGELGTKLESAILAECAAFHEKPVFVGTGGTASILGGLVIGLKEFDRERLDQARLSMSHVAAQDENLWSLTLQSRRELPGLPSNRADIILYGVAIVKAVMRHLDLSEFRVSTRGLRFGALVSAGVWAGKQGEKSRRGS